MTAILIVPVVVILAITLFDLVFRPSFRRLAFRNVARRKGEALLVVLGSLLGTAIITSSFIVGDTLDASIRDLARTELGPIDEIVNVDDSARLDDVASAVRQPALPGVDGVLSIVSAPATAAIAGKAEPHTYVHEVDVAAARGFGGDPAATGFAAAGQTPAAGQALIGQGLVDELGIGPGDQLDLHLYGTTVSVEVIGTLPLVGLAGFHPGGDTDGPSVFVAPGTIASAAGGATAATAAVGASPPENRVLVSNDGGVFDGADSTDAVTAALERRLAGVDGPTGVDVDGVKAEVLEEAADVGNELGSLFAGLGAFSVIAGILLLVNIFVMLAEERKTELGILRAVGLKRNHLVRGFGLEGALYSVAAAIAGSLVGIAVGRAVVAVAFTIFESGDDSLSMRFAAEPASLIGGAIIGLAICLLTVWGTSLRIGRLNVIRAVRDLPDPPRTGRRLRSLILASLGVLAGGFVGMSGISGENGYFALLGPALAAWSAVPLLSRLVRRRLAVTVPCAAALLWAVFAFTLLPDVFRDSDIPIFVVQGLVLVGSAVAIAIANDDLFRVFVGAAPPSPIGARLAGARSVTGVSDRFGRAGRGLALRLGLANPLARRFRTGLLLGMYSIVVFVLVMLATMARMFSALAPQETDDIRAGYDVLVDSNRANPASAAQLEAEDDVDSAAILVSGFPKFKVDGLTEDPETWVMTGFDDGLLARSAPKLSDRDAAYATDEDAWRAVLADPELAVVPDFFLQGGGPPEGGIDVGDTFTVVNAVDGSEHLLTAAAIVESDWVMNGVMVGIDAVDEYAGRVSASRAYVAVEPGADPPAVADALTARMIPNGVDASTFAEVVEDGYAENERFFQLLQGFLALGLAIGIAGLGVVMVRAARERRREIGMLRAMGFQARTVRSAFLIEAAFIAVQGVAIGVALGLVTAWSLLSNSDVFGDEPIPFRVPWLGLTVLAVAALGASLAAVYGPAARASRIKPAAALRIAD